MFPGGRVRAINARRQVDVRHGVQQLTSSAIDVRRQPSTVSVSGVGTDESSLVGAVGGLRHRRLNALVYVTTLLWRQRLVLGVGTSTRMATWHQWTTGVSGTIHATCTHVYTYVHVYMPRTQKFSRSVVDDAYHVVRFRCIQRLRRIRWSVPSTVFCQLPK